MPSIWESELPDYFYKGEKLKTKPLYTLLQKHKGYWFVFPDQKEQIEQNLTNIPWHPSVECKKHINLAGKPISREEAIAHAIPEHREQEDLVKIAVGYIHFDQYNITQEGNWQFVPTIPGSSQFYLGYRPNPNWLPYKHWFREAYDVFIQSLPEECVVHILEFHKWRKSSIKTTIKRDHTAARLNKDKDLFSLWKKRNYFQETGWKRIKREEEE